MLGLDPKRGFLTLSGKSFHVSEALRISVKNRQKHAAFEFVQKSRVSNWKKYWFSLGATRSDFVPVQFQFVEIKVTVHKPVQCCKLVQNIGEQGWFVHRPTSIFFLCSCM